ncbi:unnamed protein product [marine sediment metagenome]|uniref:Uncharacterized protein n=1 Tax=marine sediment metagenome TaxID=412755 RepID=X1HTF2_9ZZZZ
MQEERPRTYRVTKTIHLSRDIKATSAEEARKIAEDLGESGANAYASEWRAKLIRK